MPRRTAEYGKGFQARRLGDGEHSAADQAAVGVLERIALGPGRRAGAKAMLLAVRGHRRMGARMVGLQRQQVVAPARRDPLGDCPLTIHGVQIEARPG
jgi:hypothetical protein